MQFFTKEFDILLVMMYISLLVIFYLAYPPRISTILPRVVTGIQNAFVQGRLTTNNVLIAMELECVASPLVYR